MHIEIEIILKWSCLKIENPINISGEKWLQVYNSCSLPVSVQKSHDMFQITTSDVTGVHIIAFRRTKQLDLSGNVVTPPEHLSTVKVDIFLVLLRMVYK